MKKSKIQLYSAGLILILLTAITSCENNREQPSYTQSAEPLLQEPTDQEKLIIKEAEDKRRADLIEAEKKRRADSLAEVQQNAYTDAISTLLQLDNNTANIADYTSRAETMRSLDISQCPRDFAVVYIDHIHAWEHAAEIKRALTKLHSDDNVGPVLLGEGISQLLGLDKHPLQDAADAESRLNEAATDASREIKSTWEIVERSAVSYGATLPR